MELKVSRPYADKGKGVFMYGKWVTPEVHAAVSRLMNDCYEQSPVYQARQACAAFFQGGAHEPTGKWIFIEFWKADDEAHKDFIRYMQQSVSRVVISELTKVKVNLYGGTYDKGKGTLTSALMIAKETACDYDAGSWGTPFTFMPENNVQHYAILELCKEFGLPVL